MNLDEHKNCQDHKYFHINPDVGDPDIDDCHLNDWVNKTLAESSKRARHQRLLTFYLMAFQFCLIIWAVWLAASRSNCTE